MKTTNPTTLKTTLARRFIAAGLTAAFLVQLTALPLSAQASDSSAPDAPSAPTPPMAVEAPTPPAIPKAPEPSNQKESASNKFGLSISLGKTTHQDNEDTTVALTKHAEIVDSDNLTAMAAMFILFSGCVGAIWVVQHFRSRRQTMLHETLRAMIEKGVPIPPELLTSNERLFGRGYGFQIRGSAIFAGQSSYSALEAG